MTQALTSSDLELWRKITNIFGLLPVAVAEGYDRKVMPFIQPVIETRDLDCVARVFNTTLNLDITVGDFVEAVPVPVDRMYVITTMFRQSTWSANGNSFMLRDPSGTAVQMHTSDTALFTRYGMWVPVGPGWSIGCGGTDNVGDIARIMRYIILDFPSAQGEVNLD